MKFSIFILISIVFLLAFKNEEKSYPTNDFIAPIDFPIKLSGTFAELRPNHFHGGLDIKPSVRSKQGDAIFAIGDGYISRILVSANGYGNALYITHPNGYTSVYAHLQKFTPVITEYVEKRQYANQSFEFDEEVEASEFPVSKGDQIAYLGNTGGSLGAHLHFEIRDTKTDVPINPLYFGFDISDDKKPLLQQLKIYELNHNYEITNAKTYDIRNLSGQYLLQSEVLEIPSNRMAIGVKAYDNISGTSNANGIFSMDIFQDDSLIYRFQMEKIPQEETRYLNAHLDYAAWFNGEGYFNRGYRLKGNHLGIYKHLVNDGVINLANNPSRIVVIVSDFAKNESVLRFQVKRAETIKTGNGKVFNYFFPYNEASIVKRSDLELHFCENTFYENVYANIQIANDNSDYAFSPTYQIHDEKIPVHRAYEIKLKPQRRIDEKLKSKLYIGKCKDGQNSCVGNKWEGEWLTAKTRSFGDYAILLDTIPPTITPIDFEGATKPSMLLGFKLSDKGTGIKTYNAWVDGGWILMKYDGKRNMMYHEFDERIMIGKHQLVIIVTDLSGNETTFEGVFIR
jgi:murein DD-endopeptidase MepM/ murein hydrolase activator NlpD